MKYIRLSKEQLEALHHEFAIFLASNEITADDWTKIKHQSPDIAESMLDIFSDMVWETSLKKVKFLEKIEKQTLFLFAVLEDGIRAIIVKNNSQNTDFQTIEGISYLEKNILSEEFEIFTSEKKFSEDRNKDIFELIKQGGHICEGKLYNALSNIF